MLFPVDQERFNNWRQFHRANPIIFKLFMQYANQALDAGRTRFSARQIGERIRWYTSVETTDPDYKINDHHWPYYSRLLMGIDARFEGFFVTKNERFDATTTELIEAHNQ